MIKCPYCGEDALKVIDGCRNKNLSYTSRRRMCLACGRRINSREYVIPETMKDKEASLYVRRLIAADWRTHD